MTSQTLEDLARQAATGDEAATSQFLDRLQHLLSLLDQKTLQKAVQSTLSVSDGVTPELLAWARRQLTPEEIAVTLRELRELRELVDKGGGLELKDFLPELEQMVAQQ